MEITLIIIGSAIVVCGVFMVIIFRKGKLSEHLDKVREWLLYATTLAEKELGSGTGKIKLRYVYDMFTVKFPWLVKVVSFEVFSNLVDEVLDDMNNLLATNTAVEQYVNGKVEEEATDE